MNIVAALSISISEHLYRHKVFGSKKESACPCLRNNFRKGEAAVDAITRISNIIQACHAHTRKMSKDGKLDYILAILQSSVSRIFPK